MVARFLAGEREGRLSWSKFIARATAVLTAVFIWACGYAALGQGTDFDGLLAQYKQLISSGQHGPAAEVARRAQALARDRFGTGSVQYAQTLDLLGDAYFDQHKYAEAERAYRDALVIHQKRLGSDNPENIIYLSQVILCVIRQNNRGADRTSEFELLANELHRLLEAGKIPSTGIVAMGLMETGRALHGFRLYEQAIYFLERAQHLYRSFNPTDPPSLLMATHTLGTRPPGIHRHPHRG
jgi:tetratricopeptide (TPR) repeat protein